MQLLFDFLSSFLLPHPFCFIVIILSSASASSSSFLYFSGESISGTVLSVKRFSQEDEQSETDKEEEKKAAEMKKFRK